MTLNYDKTQEMRICFENKMPHIPPVTINDRQLEQVNCTRLPDVAMTQCHTILRGNSTTIKSQHRRYNACISLSCSSVLSLTLSLTYIYHNHPLRRRVRRSGVTYGPNQTHAHQLENIQKRAMCVMFRQLFSRLTNSLTSYQ